MTGVILLIVAVACVAFTNGANANFKGVASLYGSGTASLKTALLWGNGFTLAGSLTSYGLASGLLKSFSGKGIIPNDVVQNPAFAASVALAAAATSFLATRLSFPVSTTHALVGAIAGCGISASLISASESGIRWNSLASNLFFPLLLSPLIAIAFACTLYQMLKMLGLSLERRSPILDLFHFGTAAAASFARGLNDTPKMVAILILLPNVNVAAAFGFVSLFILIGGYFDAKNVAETLGKKITELTPGEGCVASFITSVLVSTASFHSLPVSTTHVSVGALVGLGLSNGKARWRMISEIFLAWITTVPCGFLLGLVIYLLYSFTAPAI